MTEELKPTELLPCPFCGGKAKYHFRNDRSSWINDHWICCEADGCGCGTALMESEAQAAAAWNRRVKEDAE